MSTEIKRLYRSRSDRMVGGVCSGIGDYLNIDPTIIRLLFAFVTLAGGIGPGLLTYLVLMIVIPEMPLDSEPSSEAAQPVDADPQE